MKIQEKHIMGPLLTGGLIISLCFTISALKKATRPTDENIPVKSLVTSRELKSNACSLSIKMLKKLITH